MTPALSRLKRRGEFLSVAATGRKAASAGLVLQAAQRAEGGVARVGFTVSRRAGNAVARNRIRRRLRALAQEVLPVAARDGFDYVLIGRAATRERPYDALRRDLVSALRRLGLCRQPTETGEARPAAREDVR